MKFEASDKVAQSTKKPHIKKGYYYGKLSQVKPRQDKDGNWIEGKFGRQVILLFSVFDDKKKPIMNPDNKDEQLVLASVLNSEYKDKDGNYRTAVTKNSRITKVFEALGWTFSPKGFDTDEFIGKWVELNIDDYDATDEEGSTYKASSIKDINKLEGDSPSSSQPEEDERVTKLKKMHEDGLLSEEGLKKALESVENGN